MAEGGEKKTILVVDDTPENIDFLASILKSDYRVKVALDGDKALKTIAKGNPDLILMDIQMPGKSGYEVSHILRNDSSTANIPIIFITGEGPDKEKEEELNAIGTISKPVDPEILLAWIKENI